MSIAIFEDRIIFDAQPPVTDAELKKVAAKCSGPLPAGLIALWRTAFGGNLDYGLEVDFKGTIAKQGITQLYFPKSDHYKDLWGWIDHELELGGTKKLDYLPFAGFEHGSRVYVCVKKGEGNGKVTTWEGGLPGWSMRLQQDSTAEVAPDVASFFRLLRLDDDPRAPRTDYGPGAGLLAAIDGVTDAKQKKKLQTSLDATVLDWPGALKRGTIAKDARLARLALYQTLEKDDLKTLKLLAKAGCDVGAQVIGGATAIDVAFVHGAKKCARWLLDRKPLLPVPNAIKNGSRHLDKALVAELLKRGATPDIVAAAELVAANDKPAALLIAKALEPSQLEPLCARLDTLIHQRGPQNTAAEKKAGLARFMRLYSFGAHIRKMRAKLGV